MEISSEDQLPERASTVHSATLQDVARAAGVTLGTASKAMNGRGKLRPETRERVRAEARRLGFRLHTLAENVETGRSLMIGILTTDSYGRFSMPLLLGVEDAFGTKAVSAILCNSRDQTRERQHLDVLLSRHVDGIIVSARREDLRRPLDAGKVSVPIVYAFTKVKDPAALCILPDDAQGARLATEHLLHLGRRHVAHVTGPGYFESVRLREGAMRQVLTEHDIHLPEHRVLSGPWRENWGYTATKFLFEQDAEIDALFCGSDQLARGALEALHDLGVHVPDDVAVVGFDNWEPVACGARPELTTIDMNLQEVGRCAGENLLAMLGGEHRSGLVLLPCSLVVRDSSGAPKPSLLASQEGGV
ncbi:MAG TPA: LacI family DNA-binding transcriptional regulator [Ktedonobacteraceae bacterium]|jgi:LacI family transcriptional regulator